MKVLTVNLATRPFRNNRVIGTVVLSVSALLLIATIANLYVFFTYRSSYAQLQRNQGQERTRLLSLEAEERRLAREIESRDFRALRTRGQFAAGVIRQQSFSWTLLFNKLEDLMPYEIMMTTIRPNITGEGINIRVDGMARNQGAFLTLQERLLASASFADVRPISERLINPTRPDIQFTMTFDYLPGVPAAPEAVVASAAGADTPEPAPREAAAQAAAPAAAPAAAATPVNREAPDGATVGRDGRARTPEVLARMMAAPGGLFIPGESTTDGAAHGDGDASGVPAAGRKNERPTAKSPAPARSEPKAGAGGVRKPGAAGKDNVSLRFESRPVREVYASLERAHAVRFALDAGVDAGEPVTADLSGKRLPEAIAEVARVAGHAIARRPDGVYRVIRAGAVSPLADRPIQEEDLPAEDRP